MNYHGDNLIRVARLSMVVSPRRLSLREGAKRAEHVLDSNEETGHLCQEAYDRICDLELEIARLKGVRY